MSSRRGMLAAGALALSLVVAACPARSATMTIVGTIAKQSSPIAIDGCTAALDGDVYTPSIQLHPDTRAVVTQSFALTFLDANGRVTGRANVTPPFVPAIADGGAFAALRCEISELRLDDGTSFSNAPPERDSHAFSNIIIGVGILAAVGFLASRNTHSGPAPQASGAATATPSPTPTPAPASTATSASPSAAPIGVFTAEPLIVPPASEKRTGLAEPRAR